jgi:hypothetical protein
VTEEITKKRRSPRKPKAAISVEPYKHVDPGIVLPADEAPVSQSVDMSGITTFDPNEGEINWDSGYIPSLESLGLGPMAIQARDAKGYADILMTAMGNENKSAFADSLAKANARASGAPDLQPYGKISIMPQTYTDGILQWQGIQPEMLLKIATDHLVIKAVVQQRIADVLRYANYATHPWKPGWKIEMREGSDSPSDQDKKEIQDMAQFISNCADGVKDARERDARHYRPLRNFLAAVVRDRFRYDFVSVWTDTDASGKVRGFKAMPADRIRYTVREGFRGDPAVFAVALDDGGRVMQAFNRRELFTVVYNERTDVDAMGYGYSETEMTWRIVRAFTDAFEMNADVFNKNAIPNGILMATGYNNKHVDALSQIWANLKKGTSKQWALPAIGVPKDGKLEILDLSRLKDNDVYFENFMNMLAGVYCAIVGFPVDRLGYNTSGKGPDNKPETDTTSGTIVDIADPGLPPLLSYIEDFINEYIVWTRNPKLQFRFQGKNPKEDARAYEAKMQAATYGERRALSDLPPLQSLAKGKEQKELAALMDLCPSDANMAPVWQNLVSAHLAAKQEAEAPQEKPPGARMTEKKDPAKSEAHGHTSGVRRDSKKESKKALSTLYVCRQVDNADDIIEWAESQGIRNLLNPGDLHVTIAYSKEPVDWDEMGTAPEELNVKASDDRSVSYLGDAGAFVLKFKSPDLTRRWHDLMARGASFDWPSFTPHITICYPPIDSQPDPAYITPYDGPILLGPEIFAPVNQDWALSRKGTLASFGRTPGLVIPDDVSDEEEDDLGLEEQNNVFVGQGQWG